MTPTVDSLRDRFWDTNPSREVLAVERIESHLVPSRGRRGNWLVDAVRITVGGASLSAFLTYAPRLVPGHVADLSTRLNDTLRSALEHRYPDHSRTLRLVVVEQSTPALIAACRDARLGLLDLGGGVFIEEGTLILRVNGTQRVPRAQRVSPFSGVGRRIVRTLLLHLDEDITATQLSKTLGVSYASVSACLTGLEQLGYVQLKHGRPPRLRRLRELIIDWAQSAPALITESFYCANTSIEALSNGSKNVTSLGGSALLTWRAALTESEVVTTGLPFAIRSAASSVLLQQAFELRRVTPHNFFIIRAEPDEDTERGGVRASPRMLPWGAAVSTIQLIADLLKGTERSREQGTALLDAWLVSLPPRPVDD